MNVALKDTECIGKFYELHLSQQKKIWHLLFCKYLFEIL